MQPPIPTSAHIGVAIREIRESRPGLTIACLAGDAEIDVSYLNEIELKRRNPTWEMIRSLGEALEVEASELVRRAEDAAKSDSPESSSEERAKP